MAISIYASRVILDALGVVDYGIYNIVGGIIVLFTFISSSMNTATQRYLNVAMGEGGETAVRKIFSNSLILYALLVLCIFIVTEIAGLWLIKNELNIPEDRMDAAIFVFHFSVLTFCLNIFRTPYNAMVIAHEQMSFYAYSSLVESGLKLVIIWMLPLFAYDKLKFYAVLVFGVAVLLLLWYYCYCRIHFPSCRYNREGDRKLIREMMSFSGWNLFGGIADVGMTQGTNMILNVFYGVTLNAAFGLANQVRGAIFSFVANLQIAANPQIVKSYSVGDISYFKNLVYSVSKYSFFLILLIALPLICNAEFILDLWLVEIPPHTVQFLILITILIIFDSLHGPLWTAMQANGDLKMYQIVMSSLLILNLPLTYLVLYMGYRPEAVIVIQIFLKVVVLAARLLFAQNKCGISITQYICKVIYPVGRVSIITVPVVVYMSFHMTNGFFRLLSTLSVSTTLILCSTYFLGITAQERKLVRKKIDKLIFKRA
ncbi:MAG: lipopolysaccharide biosynthesis protein [Dysgonomonas sp.]|nr:lipopolysaccharide biosynthesis protein [Dysgonomonas sp.]